MAGQDGSRQLEERTMEEKRPEWISSLPFPRRWLGYMTLKVIIALLAIVIAAGLYGMR